MSSRSRRYAKREFTASPRSLARCRRKGFSETRASVSGPFVDGDLDELSAPLPSRRAVTAEREMDDRSAMRNRDLRRNRYFGTSRRGVSNRLNSVAHQNCRFRAADPTLEQQLTIYHTCGILIETLLERLAEAQEREVLGATPVGAVEERTVLGRSGHADPRADTLLLLSTGGREKDESLWGVLAANSWHGHVLMPVSYVSHAEARA